eukprot:365363-Pyramimonas_sp.AAC.1
MTCSEDFNAARLREAYDALYEAFQALGIHGPEQLLAWLQTEGFDVTGLIIGESIPRNMEQHMGQMHSLATNCRTIRHRV